MLMACLVALAYPQGNTSCFTCLDIGSHREIVVSPLLFAVSPLPIRRAIELIVPHHWIGISTDGAMCPAIFIYTSHAYLASFSHIG